MITSAMCCAAAAIASVFLAGALAAVQTAVVSLASALSPGDAAVLFLWLLVGALAVAAAVVSALMLGAWARSRGRTDGDLASTEAGIAVGLLAGALGAAAALPVLESAGKAWAASVLLLVAGSVFLSVRVARSVTATVLLASGRDLLLRRRTGLVVSVVLLLLAAGASFVLLRPGVEPDEPLVVAPTGAKVVVVGIDGWSDRLPGEGEPPLAGGPSYEKVSGDPAAFWTTVATGESVARHGVGALDLVRVAGVSAPVQPVAGTGWLLGRVLPAVGLSSRESVTSASRRVPAAWEVASRAGIASLAVGWWTTYPATAGGATVLSNHLYFAARSGGTLAGEGWPADAAERAARLVPRPASGEGEGRLARDATGLDAFYRTVFDAESSALAPRLSLVYLPGLDILSQALGEPGRSAAERVVLAEALREEARAVGRFAASLPERSGASLVVLVLDGGRGSAGGRVVFLGPLARVGASGSGSGNIRPEDVAPTVLAALGVPASRSAAGRVRAEYLVPGSLDARSVASWGRRPRGTAPPIDPRAYVENLKSLGYLR